MFGKFSLSQNSKNFGTIDWSRTSVEENRRVYLERSKTTI